MGPGLGRGPGPAGGGDPPPGGGSVRVVVLGQPGDLQEVEEPALRCRAPPEGRRKPRGEAGSDPRGHLGVTWGVYLCAGKPPLADIILSHPPDLTRCDSVIGLAIPAMSGHIQNRGAASGDLYIRISGINRVLLS